MATITLGGSIWLAESTAASKAQQAQAASQERQAANMQEAPKLGDNWRVERLFRRGQLDDDWLMSSILHGAAMRYYHDHHFGHGRACENQRERLASFRAATAALGERYRETVQLVVIESARLQTVGEGLGYRNRGAAVAGALERLNQRSADAGRALRAFARRITGRGIGGLISPANDGLQPHRYSRAEFFPI